MVFAIVGAFFGLIFGGFKGLLIGGAIGYAAAFAVRQMLVGGLRVAQNALLDSTFAVMGAVCKADNVVTRDEIQTVERIFNMLRLSEPQRAEAKEAFRRGKQPDFDLDTAVDQFATIARGRGPLIQLFLQLQMMAVSADGQLHPNEHAILVRIARRLGLSEHDVRQLEALLRSGGAGPGARPGYSSQSALDDAYEALGISKDASDAELKRAYRKLISENHPDKLASRGLPESMRAVAEERSREINKAYDLIKESRGLS